MTAAGSPSQESAELDFRSIAVAIDDATVVVMEGPIDIDSLEFQTRCQIRRISELTGQSKSQVVSRAIEDLYRRVLAAASDQELVDKGRRE